MIERIKYNVFVFFARSRTKKKIRKLEQDLQAYSWYIGLEKNDDPSILQKFKDATCDLLIAKTTLKGLKYDQF